MANKYYADIFNHSGASCHRAIELFLQARDEEFKAITEVLAPETRQRILTYRRCVSKATPSKVSVLSNTGFCGRL